MMRFFQAALAALALTAFASSATAFDLGPAIGAKAPDISAKNQNGADVNYTSVKGKNGAVIAFTRAAAWCPFCQRQMVDLEASRQQIEARGYSLIVITTDSVAELAAFGQKRKIGYTMLSDESLRITDAFKLRDPKHRPTASVPGVPVPSIFIVDSGGVVKAKLGDEDYRNRPTREVLLAAIDGVK